MLEIGRAHPEWQWCTRRVVDHGKNRALRQHLIAQSNKGEDRAAVDGHAFGCELVRFGFACIELATVSAVGIESRLL